jgi:hypothetical protein
MAFVVIGLILSTGVVLAGLLAPGSLDGLAAAWAHAWGLIAGGLGLALFPVVSLLVRLLGPFAPALFDALHEIALLIGRMVGAVRSFLAWLVLLLTLPLPRIFDVELIEALLHSPAMHISVRWLALVLLVAGGGLIFWLALRRALASPLADGDEVRDSILSGPLIWAQLRGLLARRRQRPERGSPPYLPLAGPGDDPRLIVRRAYQAMLEWALSIPLPRAAGQTPGAYADALAGLVPEGREAIQRLTGVYLLARYAAEAPSLEDARFAEGAVACLRQLRD